MDSDEGTADGPGGQGASVQVEGGVGSVAQMGAGSLAASAVGVLVGTGALQPNAYSGWFVASFMVFYAGVACHTLLMDGAKVPLLVSDPDERPSGIRAVLALIGGFLVATGALAVALQVGPTLTISFFNGVSGFISGALGLLVLQGILDTQRMSSLKEGGFRGILIFWAAAFLVYAASLALISWGLGYLGRLLGDAIENASVGLLGVSWWAIFVAGLVIFLLGMELVVVRGLVYKLKKAQSTGHPADEPQGRPGGR